MNLFSIADSAEAYLERKSIDHTFVALRFVKWGVIGAYLLWHASLHPPLVWGVIVMLAYLAYDLFVQRRPDEMDARPDDRLIAAAGFFWRAATFSLALLMLAWSSCHLGNGGWCLLLIALAFWTNIFGPILFVRWFRWHLQP